MQKLTMANIDDVRNSRGRYQRELAKLDDAVEQGVVNELDRDAVVEYIAVKRRDTGSLGTVITYLNRIRTSAERAYEPLVCFKSVGDIEAVLAAHEEAGATATSTLNNHLSALRQFFEWLDNVETHGHDDYSFRTDVENLESNSNTPGSESIDPGIVLSERDIAELRKAATHPRERALVEFLANTGLRIGTVCQMRCGDVITDGEDAGSFHSTSDASTIAEETGQIYPLYESRGHLRTWLYTYHPEAPNPPDDAPLFPVKRGYEAETCKQCALSPSAAEDALRNVADAASIEAGRVRPYNLRRTAAIRMRAKHGMSWDAIQSRGGWSDESLAELKRVYRRIEASDNLTLTDCGLVACNVAESGDTTDNREACVDCGADIPPNSRFCPLCGIDQSVEDRLLSSPQGDDVQQGVQCVEAQQEYQGIGPDQELPEDEIEKENDDLIRRQREKIALFDRLNKVIGSVNEVLITAGGQSSILDGVANRLAESRLYEGAWASGESLAASATPQDQKRETADTFDGTTVVEGSLAEAQLSFGVPNDGSALPIEDAIDRNGLSQNDGRWTTVPVVHGRTVYGTIVLFSSRANAFGKRELSVLDDLGRQVGHAVNAAEKELLLLSDTVTELRFAAHGDDPLAVVSQAADCTLTVQGIVPTSGADVVVYCGVEGDIHETVAALSKADGIVSLRPIDESTVECRLGHGTLAVPLREVGAQLERLVAENGVCTVVARVSPETDVRTIVERIQRSVPATDLQAKRRRVGGEVAAITKSGASGLAERLTDRQREMLEAAYDEGYFDWPRESTAEEVADEMGVTSKTVHNHLRKAENEVLGAFLGKI